MRSKSSCQLLLWQVDSKTKKVFAVPWFRTLTPSVDRALDDFTPRVDQALELVLFSLKNLYEGNLI